MRFFKYPLAGGFVLASALTMLFSGCSSSGGATVPAANLPTGTQQYAGMQQYPDTQQVPAVNASSQFVGTWVHTYQYFDQTYRTTLVISANGTAVYYNEEAALGNFNATWQESNGQASVRRSDGLSSTLTVSGNVLTEQSYENGEVYTAEYYRS